MARISARDRLAALRALCRLLNGEGSGCERWDEIVALADELLVAAPLWNATRGHPDRLPGATAEALRERYRANTLRNARLRRDLMTALKALNDAGIVPLLFKGALQLADPTLGEVGGRWMSDLDILVAPDEMAAAEAALSGIGYRPDRSQPWVDYEVPFQRRRGAGPIDLHSALGSAAIGSILPTGEAWAGSTLASLESAQARALSPTHQVLHNIVHSAVQELSHVVGSLPLRQLITLSSLASAHGAAVDWVAIQRRMEAHHLGRELRDHLWLAHRFAGMTLPFPNDSRRRFGASQTCNGTGASRFHSDPRRGSPRLHEVRVLAGFALGWPVDVQRNLHQALGRTYMESRYGHGNRPLKLAGARARHAAGVLRRDGRRALDEMLVRKS